jgi:hypothetical protein
VVLSSLFLFWLVVALTAYMILFRLYHRLRSRYRQFRGTRFRPAIEMVLMDEPLEKVVDALRPRWPGDGDIVQDIMLDAMRHLEGPPFDCLREVARILGFVDSNLRALLSANPHRRGRAMDRLGVMRLPEASGRIAAAAVHEDLELRLVALRALASIGDPAVLPSFVEAAEGLPPPLLPRLASLMFEFGAPGRRAVVEIINRHPRLFPAACVKDILMQLASDYEVEA